MNDGVPVPTASEPVHEKPPDQNRGRHPLVSIAVAMACGIVLDRLVVPPFFAIVIVAAAAVALWVIAYRLKSSRVSAICFLTTCAAMGATHHHVAWFSTSQDDIAQFLPQEPTLLKVEGTVVGRPATRITNSEQRASWQADTEATRFILNCESIAADGPGELSRRSVRGHLQVDVFGEPPAIGSGDRIELIGKGNGIPRSQNPGEWDFEAFLRNRGIRGLLRVADKQLVRVIDKSQNPLRKLQSVARDRCDSFLRDSMSEKTQPIAAALLLGDRTSIPNDVRAAFVESGTMHLLAISGLHVGIVTAFILRIARLAGLNTRWSVIGVLGLLTLYLNIADLRPPMVRAFTLVAIWGVGRLLRRPSFSANSLAAAGVVVLVMNPSDLFDIGAQLSFLAVASMIWFARVTKGRSKLDEGDFVATRQKEAAERALLRPSWRVLRNCLERLKTAHLLSATICLISAPLVAAEFNVVSPIGMLINVFLISVVGFALCCGFLGMLLGAIWFPLGWPLAIVFDWILRFVLWVVDFSSSIYLGHIYVPAPPLWWLLGLYALIGTLMTAVAFRRRTGWGWVVMIGWSLFGLSIGMQARDPGNLRCTFLSVQHGCSILVEMPNGQTLVYDVGSLMNPLRASRVLEQALWQRGHGAIDALVLSHADSDHYNGTHSLLDHFPTKRVLMTRHFVDSDQPGTVSICERLLATRIPIDVIARGDRINLDPRVSIEVLHPTSADAVGNDNSVSVVLEITYYGRSILFTGDLEEPGLSELLAQRERAVDVLLAPHHGSTESNVPELARWAKPRFVVASTGRQPSPHLAEVYGEHTEVLWTSRDGAVTFEFSSDGTVTRTTFVGQQ